MIFSDKKHIAAICLLTVLFSIPSLATPFLTDMITYHLIGRKISLGAILYLEAADSKPPLIYFTYALFSRIFSSWSVAAIKIAAIGIKLLTTWFVYLSAKELFDKKTAVAAAYLFTAAMFCGLADDFQSPNTELWMNLFAASSVYFFVRRAFSFQPVHLFICGMLLSAAFLYRYHAGVYGAVFFILIISASVPFRQKVLHLLCIGAGFAVPLAALLGYFHHHHALDDLAFWSVSFNFFYIKTGAALADAILSIKKISLITAGLLVPIVLSLMFFIAAVRRRAFSRTVLFLALLLAANIYTYTMGGRFYGHYFLQAVPVLCIAAAGTLQYYRDAGRKKLLRISSILMAVTMTVFFAANMYLLHTTTRDINPDPQLTSFIQQQTKSGDRIFLWDESKRFYYWSDRIFATRFVHTNYQTGRIWGTSSIALFADPAETQALQLKKSWDMLMQDLEKEKPALIIDFPSAYPFSLMHYEPLRTFTEKNYFPHRINGRDVFIRNDRAGAAR